MNLLSPKIPLLAYSLLALALVGGTLLTVWIPRRAWRRRVWPILLNGLVVILASTLSLLSAFLLLNHESAWYPTLDDLMTDPQVRSHTQGDPTKVFAEESVSPAPQAAALPPLPQPGQRRQTYFVPTSVGEHRWKVEVILPPGYDHDAMRTYPVIVFAHGSPGSPDSWLSSFHLQQTMDKSTSERAIAPFIAVIPSLLPDGHDTECANTPSGPVETFLSSDLPSFVRAHLRAGWGRTRWAMAGFSFGGWCTAMSVMLHPTVYSAGIVISGYFQPQWPSTPPFPPTSAESKRLDLVALARTNPPKVGLWIQSSQHDAGSWTTTRDFLAASKKSPMVISANIDNVGGHDWHRWVEVVPPSLAWLGATVPGFRPA